MKSKKLITSIICILILIIAVSSVTYAFITAVTNEGNIGTGSGMLDINYDPPDDINGNLILSFDRSGGLFTSAKASLKNESVAAILNMYITPTSLTNLNIEALKWEAEGIRNNEIICSGSGNFASAVVDEPIKLFKNDVNDNIDDCQLSTDETIFNIYIWLDAKLVNTSIGGATFGATIGADSVQITGDF